MIQPDLFEARRLRDLGIERSADHAEREHEGWKKLALERFIAYAKTHEEFITEDVRAANADIPEPPDRRAWGHIARAALKAGHIVKAGYREAKDPKVHCSINTLWRSLAVTP